MLWSHSQGGGAALGAVVTSPAADLPGLLASLIEQPGLGGFIPLVASGAKVTEPALRLDRVFAPAAGSAARCCCSKAGRTP